MWKQPTHQRRLQPLTTGLNLNDVDSYHRFERRSSVVCVVRRIERREVRRIERRPSY